jgi:tetratricopeptide (TPR) repeat protein
VLASALLTVAVLAGALGDVAEYRAGMKLLEDLEYDQAAAAFEEALAKGELSDEERATLLVRLANTRNDLRERERAHTHLEEAVALHAAVAAPADASPELKKMLEAVRAAHEATSSAPVDQPPPAPAPVEPADPPPALEAPAPPANDGAGLGVLTITGGAVAAAGAATLLGGAISWGAGLYLVGEAEKAPSQAEGAATAESSALAQIVGQSLVAVGATVTAVGVAVLVAGLVVE